MVDPHETLFVVPRKRFVKVYEAGELTLHVGTQEIGFDEPELFPWAEKLIEQDSFLAGQSTGWSVQPLEWPRVSRLLEDLIEAGILARAPRRPAADFSQAHLDFVAGEEARPSVRPRFWDAEVLRDLAGRDLPLGFLESVVPVHRLAHIALDREGRQVGEANTFPESLRLKVPTEWKICGYAGSRYRDEMPMNMTALRSMLAHWKPVLRTALACRAEFVRRRPQPPGRFRLGDLLFLTSGILALPAFLMLRHDGAVRNGELEPVLSSLFRVVDGVRMVAGHMLDLYERPLFHDSLVAPEDLGAAGEIFDMYRSAHGVCAGPQAMIDELLTTLVDGTPAAGDWTCPWFAEIPAALDYAMRGRQLNAVTFTVWVRMGLAFTRIHEALQRAHAFGWLGRLREAVARDFQLILPGRNHQVEQRDFSERYYREMFDRAQLAVRDPGEPVDFAAAMSPPPELLGERAASELRDLFVSIEEPRDAAQNAGPWSEIAGYLVDYLRFERNALRVVVPIQTEINRMLGREQPRAALTSLQLASTHTLRKGTPGGTPYLLETLREAVGVEISSEASSTVATYGKLSIALH
jgi:hypothetical protein